MLAGRTRADDEQRGVGYLAQDRRHRVQQHVLTLAGDQPRHTDDDPAIGQVKRLADGVAAATWFELRRIDTRCQPRESVVRRSRHCVLETRCGCTHRDR